MITTLFERRALWPAVLLLLSACAGAPPRLEAPHEAVELSTVPFFAQTEHHCGPAALATLLAAQGIAVTPDQLSPLIYLPGREGTLQAEMIAATRRYNRLPLRLEPTPEAVIAALGAGQPVLLLQNLGFRRWPSWHYAVAVGYESEDASFILRSGTEQRLTTGLRRFLQTWDRADRWAFVAVEPDQVPANATLEAWLAAAAPFESLGRVDMAERAYKAALNRWPSSSLAWQGLANTRYAANDKPAAEAALLKAVELDPASVTARNNLASVLLERGCVTAARAQLDALGEVPAALANAVGQTRRDVDSMGTREDPSGCPSP